MSPGEDRTGEPREPLRTERMLDDALRPEFELLRPVGRGATARVFVARETAVQRLVAVKVLDPSAGADEVTLARFEREATTAGGISHPSVPTVYRVGRLPDGLPFIVQEYIEGRTLADRLDATGVVEPGEARRILCDVAGALAAAHARDVVHRDVCSANVILEHRTGRAVLTDFGVAGFRHGAPPGQARLTSHGEVLGNLAYASPEELRGEPVTEQVDVYSLGIVGYELLTGESPYGPLGGRDAVSAHLEGEPLALPPAVRSRDPALADLLQRCLAKDPRRRPRAADLVRALEAPPGAGAAAHVGDVLPTGIREFLDELRRRRVARVAGAYTVSAVVVLSTAELLLNNLGVPEEILRGLTLAVLGGFPVVVVLSWVFDLTARGIQRTAPASAGASPTLKAAGLVATIGLVVFLGWLLLG